MHKTLLLVFIHGFKGTDHTFENFPADLRALLAHTLPKIQVVSVQYPQYETKGDLKECVAKFREWLQNKVIDLEIENKTPSPTIDPSVHVVLCGHSMGGIVAAETLLSIAHEEVVPPSTSYPNDTTNTTTRPQVSSATKLGIPEDQERPSSTPPVDPSRILFPCIRAIVAFDTPYLGISPGVLAHGAEEQINQASSAYKAFDSASSFFGWGSPRNSSPIPDAANKALPAPAGSASSRAWSKWGKYAAFGGAAAATLAAAGGAAYLSRNQISQGFAWAGSHLEFVSVLARGADLQKRVESVVQLTKSHNIGFADFYTALDVKLSMKYSSGAERTFCVVPKNAPDLSSEMQQGEEVRQFAQDSTKSKGHWVKCVNDAVTDEVGAHTAMFSPKTNPRYHSMLPSVRDEIAQWVDQNWYQGVAGQSVGGAQGENHDGPQESNVWA